MEKQRKRQRKKGSRNVRNEKEGLWSKSRCWEVSGCVCPATRRPEGTGGRGHLRANWSSAGKMEDEGTVRSQ